MRVILDTNTAFDIFCKRPYDEKGLTQLKIMQAFSDVELWLTAKSYADLFHLMRRELGPEAALNLLEDTLTWIHACSLEETDIQAALKACWSDFENSLVNVCAEKVKADFILTRDKKGFRRAKIPHGTASEFIDYVFDKTGVRYAVEETSETA